MARSKRWVGRTAHCSMAIALVLAWPSSAQAGSLGDGLKAVERGDFARAYKEFAKSTRPEAPYYIGRMALAGEVPGCDANCALEWFRKAVERDYIPALNQIAMLYYNDGQKEAGIAILQFAARWNDANSSGLLREMGQVVPPPDLWNQRVAELQALQQEQQRAQASSDQILGFALGAFLSGYSGHRSNTRSSNQPSYSAPLPIQNPIQRAPIGGYGTSATSGAGSQDRTMMCPDGSYVYGTRCSLAPNGSYLPGQARLAPDGTYVVGQPRLTPDGSYVGGSGRTILCPDGSYVVGSRCQLAPNGQYLGIP